MHEMRWIVYCLRPLLSVVLVRNSKRNVFVAALTLLASNLVVNAFVLRRVLGPQADAYRGTLLTWHLVSSGLALVLLLLKGANRLPSLRVIHLLGGWLFLEVAIRIALFHPSIHLPALENPSLFFWATDTRYWVAHSLHYRNRKFAPEFFHPRLGWVLAPEHPLGVLSNRFRSLDDLDRRPLLFFGDSFVAGTVESMDEKVPQILDRLLTDYSVLNFGVHGYGVDQIALRVREEYPKYRHLRPKVLIGLYTRDLWRSMLAYRQLQKPYFTMRDDGGLDLHLPRHERDEEYLRNFSFASTSFVACFLEKLVLKLLGREAICGGDCEELNRRILAKTVAWIRREGVDARFVIFTMPQEALEETPEEVVLRRILADLGVEDPIDTKAPIREYLLRNDLEPEELWVDAGDSHYNGIGNRILATTIARALLPSESEDSPRAAPNPRPLPGRTSPSRPDGSGDEPGVRPAGTED